MAYELLKKHGPLAVYINGYVDPVRGAQEDSRDDPFVQIESAGEQRTWIAYVEGRDRRAASALIKHCVNNFDKALEALRKTNDMMNALRAQVKADHGYCKSVDMSDELQDANVRLIAELETVEEK